MKLPKPIGIKELIQLLKERIARYEKDLEVLNNAELRYPEHIELRNYEKKKMEKRLKEDKKALEKLKKVIKE